MAVGLYLNFNGNCFEAVQFYANVFNTDMQQIMKFKDAPNPNFPISDEVKELILHTYLNINGSVVMFSDTPPEMPFTVGNNISLVIKSKNLEELKNIFSKLKEGGTVEMELNETFWSKCYGFLTDKFGVSWQISYDNEEDM